MEIKYECPECGFVGNDNEWGEDNYYMYCELWGDHDAYKCPSCGELYDDITVNRTEIKNR